jgi:hypothetical protein
MINQVREEPDSLNFKLALGQPFFRRNAIIPALAIFICFEKVTIVIEIAKFCLTSQQITKKNE